MRKLSLGLSKEEAIALAESKWWIGKPVKEVALFQLREKRLCMDFSEFHRIIEEALGRPVYTHEFVDPNSLIKEMCGEIEAPSLKDIIQKLNDRIGSDKVVVVKS